MGHFLIHKRNIFLWRQVGGEEVGVEEEAGEEAVGHTIRSIDSGERVPSVE